MKKNIKCSWAPIIVFAYNRPEHLRKTLLSLNSNIEIEQSNIYIFVDGPKEKSDFKNVGEVYNVIEDFISFSKSKNVYVKKKKSNDGLANSVIKGVSSIINKYGRVIVLEDDLVLSNNFLVYMNRALEYYKDSNRIWSISGFNPIPQMPDKYNKDVFFTTRGCSWGWGTWSNRWDKVDWECKDYSTLKYYFWRKRLLSLGGYDTHGMLDAQMKGKIDSWAIRWCYEQSKHLLLTVYPTKSFIMNTGYDGTGTHEVSKTIDYRPEIDKCENNVKFEKPFMDLFLLERFKRCYGEGTIEHYISSLKRIDKMVRSLFVK